jgi:ABC-2 type transport system permease protein
VSLAVTLTLAHREVVRFLRQKNRIVGALGTPVVFWLLIGSGVGRTFQMPGADYDYLRYFFPGALLLTVLFTAVFSTISIIEDRREGFLQGVLVAPVSRSSIVAGKILGGTALAVGQGLLFLAAGPLLGLGAGPAGYAAAAVHLTVLSVGLTGLGFLLAWRMDSSQGFHAVMNLLLMPMWFLSGALFPTAGAPVWMRAVMHVNPLTFGMAGLLRALLPDLAAAGVALPSTAACLGVEALFAAAMFALCLRAARRPG